MFRKISLLGLITLLILSVALFVHDSTLEVEAALYEVDYEQYRENHDKSVKAFDKIINILERNQDIPFSGGYIDDNGLLNIGLAGTDKDEYKHFIINEIKDLAVDVKFFKAQYSYEELKELQIKFGDEWERLTKEGIVISHTYVSQKEDNKFYVAIVDPDQETIQKIKEVLGHHPGIEVIEGALMKEQRQSYHSPLIGGIKVAQNSSGGGGSTIALSALDSSGNRGVVISGHAAVALGSSMYQPTSNIGWVQNNPFGPRSSDAAFVRVAYRSLTGKIYPSLNLDSILPSTHQYVGMDVSMHGMDSGRTNGRITQIGVQVPSDDYGTLNNQIIANYASDYGDSGAPITNRYTAGNYSILGIHVGENSSTSKVYSSIEAVISELSLSRPVWYNQTY